MTSRLPRINIKVLLAKERNDDRTIGELPARQRRQRLLRRLGLLVLDIDLADAVILPVAGRGTGHLDVEHGAVLGAFVFDVVEDFYSEKAIVS